MSEFLDALARQMALAVTRRDAAKVLLGAVAGAVVSRGWFAEAQNYPCRQGSFECLCPGANGMHFRLCCHDDYRCKCDPRAAICTHTCAPFVDCGQKCCPPNRICCDAARSQCCGEGEKCGRYGTRGICCKTRSCQATKDDDPICCPNPDDECVADASAGSGPRRCCPAAAVIRRNGDAQTCCPPGSVALGDKMVVGVVGSGANGPCCPAAQACRSGTNVTCCQKTSSGEQTCCHGECRDLQVDFFNCGTCGVSCKQGELCRNGACVH